MTQAPLSAPQDEAEQRAIGRILGAFDDKIELINCWVVALIPNDRDSSETHLYFDLERRDEQCRQLSRQRVVECDRVAALIVRRIVASLKETRALADCRDTLLPKLISGKLRVPAAERVAAHAGV